MLCDTNDSQLHTIQVTTNPSDVSQANMNPRPRPSMQKHFLPVNRLTGKGRCNVAEAYQ